MRLYTVAIPNGLHIPSQLYQCLQLRRENPFSCNPQRASHTFPTWCVLRELVDAVLPVAIPNGLHIPSQLDQLEIVVVSTFVAIPNGLHIPSQLGGGKIYGKKIEGVAIPNGLHIPSQRRYDQAWPISSQEVAIPNGLHIPSQLGECDRHLSTGCRLQSPTGFTYLPNGVLLL